MSARDQPADVLDHGVLRFLTAGSVDDGKSTLIGRLLYDTKAILADQLAAIERTSARAATELDLSLLTDGLTAEREQGITIDVAYRYFATARRKFIIADAPGHEQYTRNMVTAASTAQLAVLLVDARHGVVTQTRRHADARASARHPRTWSSRSTRWTSSTSREEAFARIVADFRDFAERTGIDEAGVRFVPMSALDGDMVVERGDQPRRGTTGPTLLRDPRDRRDVGSRRRAAAFRFPVQYVSRPAGDARARLHGPRRGRLDRGRRRVSRAAVGPDARACARSAPSTAARARAAARRRSRSSLADEIDISRGDMIVHAEPARRWRAKLEATLCWLDERPLDARRTYVAAPHDARGARARRPRSTTCGTSSTQAREPAPERLR